jgi:LPXTG-motif cell wall-anchored protein
MAATSASRGWAAFTRRALTTGAVAAVGLIALAIPASAHVPDVHAGCDGEITTLVVNLTQYSDAKPNTIKVVEGKGNVLADTTFGASYHNVFKAKDGEAHDFVVTVHASDDQKFSFEKKLTAPACKKVTSTKPTPPTTTTKPTSSSAGVPPVTTTTTPAVGANASLASTGASVGLPLAIGALLLIGGGVLLLVMRKRGKA